MKSVALILAFGLFSNYLVAQCISGNCSNGHGKYKLSDKSIYSGQFKNKRFHGQGKLNFSNGDIYIGGFHKGHKSNLGKYQFKDGSYYVGDFKNDVREGKGKMVFPNGEIYKGEWSAGEMDGNGEYQFKDGSTYEGQFSQGKLSGNGTIVSGSGEIINGKWNGNKLEPETTLQHEEATNVNNVIKNCTNSYCDQENGAYYYEDGSVYFGQFVKGNPEGEGRCEYINGDIYTGGWKNHAPHGEGIMHLKNDHKIAGSFHLGNLIKRSYVDITENNQQPIVQKKQQKANKNDGSQIYAVIVGVAAYNHMKSLKYTDDDAYQLYAFLKSPQGGAIPDNQISVLIDDGATKAKIESTMQDVFSKADDDDVILLYLSGHGLNGAFVPSDFDGANNLLSYATILSIFNASSAKNKLCITDACHSGSMYASKGIMENSLETFYNEINTNNGGVAMMTSSKEDEVSLEYSGMRQGVFSHFLIRGLKGEANNNNDQIIDIGELFQYVYKNVQYYTNYAQTPSIMGNYSKVMPVAMVYEN